MTQDDDSRRPRHTREVVRAYDRWAPSYDEDENATRDLDARVLRAAPLDVAGAEVVELGCGTGKNTVWLAEHARRVVAMDFSLGMLAKAHARVSGAHVQFIQHDVRMPWSLPPASVDVVVGNLVLEHVADVAPVFAHAARALRPGGRLFFCELHPVRQWRGGRAHFTDSATGETVHVPAFLHNVGDYVNTGLAAGLALRHLGEWVEDGAAADVPPRLLSVLFERPA